MTSCMPNINKNPHHVAQLSKNGFPMSQTNFYTSSVGMILPVYYDFLNPGDKIRFSAESFARTEEMTAPTFMKLRQVTRWFFVPFQQLFSPFGSIFYGINDLSSSMFNASAINELPLVNLLEVGRYFSQSDTNKTFDEHGIEVKVNAKRIYEMLNFGQASGSGEQPYFVNPLLACAYQKIYNDKFRLSDRQSPDVSSWNIDLWYNSQITAEDFVNKMLRLHYVPYGKDFFTNCQVAPLVGNGDNSMLSLPLLDDVNQWLDFTSSGSYSTKGVTTRDNKTVSGTGSYQSQTNSAPNTYATISSTLTTANLRSMFAVEKLSEITRRAAKHYDAQTLAHFGAKVPEGISGEVFEIGSSSVPVQVSDIVSTATTELSPLGDMAGRGNGYGTGKPNSFKAPCHGVLMAVQYFIPDTTYNGSLSLSRFNTYKSRVDFYQPEFDRLGMQPLFAYQAVFNPSMPPTVANSILGWQYRYMEYKQKANFSYGAFNTSRSNWVARRYQNPQSTDIKYFLVSPNYLDNNMAVNFDPSTYDNDPLNCMVTLHVLKSSVMSTYGLPKL